MVSSVARLLHSVCFERAPVKRRTTTSTTSSDDSKQRDDLEILRRERRWLERERENVSTRQVLFEEAKLRSIEALRAEGEEQSEERSRVNEIEAQLRKTQISLEETEYLDEYRPTRDADDEVCIMCNTSSHIHTHRTTRRRQGRPAGAPAGREWRRSSDPGHGSVCRLGLRGSRGEHALAARHARVPMNE
jgi:hypothetical protein